MSDARLWSLVLLIACAPSPPAPAAPPPLPITADLQGVMERAHFAFHPRGLEFETRHAGQRAAMTPEGRMRISTEGRGGKLELKLESVQRGSTAWTLASPAAVAVSTLDGSLEARWAHGIEERWLSCAEGFEQTFVLPQPPSGRGEVALHLAARGLDYAGHDARGHHFRDAQTGLALRYENASARVGDKTLALEVRHTAQGLDIIVPDALARRPEAWPLRIDPLVTRDVPLDAPVVAQVPQSRPVVAFDQDHYVVAWEDRRAGGGVAIYAARVSLAGVALDPYGIPLSTDSLDQTSVALACDAAGTQDCLAVWVVSGENPNQLLSRHLYGSAGMLSPAPLQLDFGNSNAHSGASVSFDGTAFIVVATDNTVGNITGGSYALMTSAFAPFDATLPGGTGVIASDALGNSLIAIQASVSGNQVIHLATFTSGAAHLNAAGSVPAGLQPLVQQFSPAVTFSGPLFEVAWLESQGLNGIYGVDVTSAGTVVQSHSIMLDGPDGGADSQVRLVGSNSLVQVAYTHTLAVNTTPYAAQWIPVTGIVMGASPVDATEPNGLDPAVGCTATGSCLFAWTQPRASALDGINGRIDVGTGNTPLSSALNDELMPRVAVNASTFGVVWEDTRDTFVGSIYFATVSSEAAVSGEVPVASSPGKQELPDIATDGQMFFIVWVDYGGSLPRILAQLLNSSRMPTGGSIVVAAAASRQSSPAVIWDGNEYVVAWEDQRNGASDIYYARFDSTGAKLDSLDHLGASGGATLNERHPALAAVDSVALLTWDETVTSTELDISARRIDLTTGNIIDTTPLLVSGAFGSKSNPSVAAVPSSNGNSFFITWTDATSGINAARLALDGGSDGGVIAVNSMPGSAESNVVFDGTRLVVAWQMPDGGVGARRFNASSGAGLGPLEVMSNRGSFPALAFTNGTGLCATQVFEPTYGAMRVHLLTLDSNDDDGGSVMTDAGSPNDGGLVTSDGGATVLCDANHSATVGLPYIFNASERVVVVDAPSADALAFIDCSATVVPGFHVDAQTGSVAWVPQMAGVFSLCVNASGLPTASACKFTVTVSAADAGAGPDAGISVSLNHPSVGELVTAYGSSGLPADAGVFYRWDFGDMTPLAFGAQPTHQYGLAGGYQISLTVLDAFGRSSSTKVPIRVQNVQPRTNPPVVVVRANPLVGIGTQAVTFTPAVTSGDGMIETYSWDFGDGATDTGSAPQHMFSPGRYRVRLRVTDANLLEAVDSVMVEVDDPQKGAPPSCRAWVSPAVQQLPDDLAFTFFAEDDYDLSTDGGIVSQVLTVATDTPPSVFEPQLKTLTSAGTARSELVVQNAALLLCHDNAEAVLLPGPTVGLPLIGDAAAPAGTCGRPYSFAPLIAGQQPITFAALDLPDGGAVDPATGALSWNIPPATQGTFDFTLLANNDAGAAMRDFSIDVTCAPALQLPFKTEACGCTGVGPSALALLSLLLLRRRRGA